MEVPIAFPLALVDEATAATTTTTTFVVNDTAQTIRPSFRDDAPSQPSSSAEGNDASWDSMSQSVNHAAANAAAAAASSSVLRYSGHVVTTGWAARNGRDDGGPDCLAVSLWRAHGSDGSDGAHASSTTTSTTSVAPLTVVYLDLQSETTRFGPIAKIQAFDVQQSKRYEKDEEEEDEDEEETTTTTTKTTTTTIIYLLLVDTSGIILQIPLQAPTLQPVSNRLRMIATLDHLHSTVATAVVVNDRDRKMLSASQPGSLVSSLIAMLSHHCIVLAPCPWILTVDWADTMDDDNNHDDDDNNNTTRTARTTVHVWSKAQCVQDMRTRRTVRVGQFFSLRGVAPDDGTTPINGWLDRTPVSALCVADQNQTKPASQTRNDDKLVFTLHADGTLLAWTVPAQGHRGGWPRTVHEYVVPGLPPAPLWTHAGQVLSARIFTNNNNNDDDSGDDRRYFALAMCLRVDEDVVYTNDNDDNAGTDTGTLSTLSPCRLFAMDGILEQTSSSSSSSLFGHGKHRPEVSTLTPTRLELPPEARVPIGLFFDPHPPRVHLVTLFYHPEQQQSVFLTFPPSNVSIVGSQPIRAPMERFLDQVALDERARLSRWSNRHEWEALLDNNSSSNDDDYEVDVANVIHAIDGWFLKYLLRPVFPRGTGSVLPPSTRAIRQALRQLVPHYETAAATAIQRPRSSSSIQVELLSAMQLWRSREERRLVAPRTPRPLTGFLQPAEEQPPPPQQGMEVDDERDNHEESAKDQVREQALAHETRWRQLLMEIWKEEEWERVPLFFGPSPSANDAGILIRSCATSALVHVAEDQINRSIVGPLNDAAIAIMRESSLSEAVFQLEQEMWIMVANLNMVRTGTSALYRGIQKIANAVPDTKLSDALKAMVQVSSDQEAVTALVAALETTSLDCNLPGLCCHSKGEARYGASALNSFGKVAGRHCRMAALSLAARSLDSARRLLLGRVIILTKLSAPAKVTNTAIRMYLHALTVQLAAAQMVPTPVMAAPPRGVLGASGPASLALARPDNNDLGVLGAGGKTLAMDAFLMYISQKLGHNNNNAASSSRVSSLTSSVLLLGTAAMESSILVDRHPPSETPPELEILGRDVGPNVKLALCLLTPSVLFPRAREDPTTNDLRKEQLAQFLLMSSSLDSDPDRAKDLVFQAFRLLKFDPRNLEKSMARVNMINQVVPSSMQKHFLFFIGDAIRDMIATYPEDWLASSRDFCSLCSTRFYTALACHDWDQALKACQSNPDVQGGFHHYRRLVIAMVDSGALFHLVQLCSSLAIRPLDDAYGVSPKQVDLYAIACDALAEAGGRDLYLDRVKSKNPPSDYNGALYCLHVCKAEWRRAAHALDMLYEAASKALANPPPHTELDPETAEKRKRLIVRDLRFAAVTSYFCLSLVTSESERYIVSGETGDDPLLPIFARQMETRKSVLSRGERKKSLHNLKCRAARMAALATLFADREANSELARTFVQDLHNDGIDSVITAELFRGGHYYEGLMLVQLVSGKGEVVHSSFDDVLLSLLVNNLVPLAVDRRYFPGRPTYVQLIRALDGAEESSHLAPVLVGSRSKKLALLERSAIREAAMALICSLVTRYSTAERPVGVRVAAAFLRHKEVETIPAWLEQLLVHGTTKADLPGSFALRRQEGVDHGFLGDPSALVTVYTDACQFKDACRIVCAVLDRSQHTKATARLPEKGDIDFVPYNKLDLLFELMEQVLSRGQVNRKERAELEHWRDKMTDAIVRHFNLLKVSALGLDSARALASP